jgi:hypothetical protein
MQKRRVNEFVAGVIAIVIGALMIAEGTLGWVTGQSLFYAGVNPTFKFVVGFLVIVLASHLLEKE